MNKLYYFKGGMIARALFTLPDFDPQTVNTIFMQATPNQAPGESALRCQFDALIL